MNYTRSLISCIKNSRACFIGAKDSRLRLESLSADKTRSFVLYTLLTNIGEILTKDNIKLKLLII